MFTAALTRVTKFLIDRSAIVKPTLTTTDYRFSALIQGGLRIACKVSVKISDRIKSHYVTMNLNNNIKHINTNYRGMIGAEEDN